MAICQYLYWNKDKTIGEIRLILKGADEIDALKKIEKWCGYQFGAELRIEIQYTEENKSIQTFVRKYGGIKKITFALTPVLDG